MTGRDSERADAAAGGRCGDESPPSAQTSESQREAWVRWAAAALEEE